MNKKIIVSLIAILAAVLIAGGIAWQCRFDLVRKIERAQLPVAQEYRAPTTAPSTFVPVASIQPEAIANVTPASLPAEANLAVPFTVQAPHAKWELPYKEFCEEASVLMTMRYLQNRPLGTADQVTADLLDIKEFEETTLGEYQDTNVKQTAAIITDHFKYSDIAIVTSPTAQDIRAALADGKPVIAPMAGRLLGNPYFQQPGPLYHMVVVKGYTADGSFIVNDPGTRRGADFVYSEAVIMNAIHDWRDDENITAGDKAVIIVGA